MELTESSTFQKLLKTMQGDLTIKLYMKKEERKHKTKFKFRKHFGIVI